MKLRRIPDEGCANATIMRSLLFTQTCRWLLASACLFLCSLSALSQIVTTDKPDYTVGETVIITGSGFMPGETVEMVLHETPQTHEDEVLYSVADASGGFVNMDFVICLHDLGVTFDLTATGLTSGLVATTTFTDGPPAANLDQIRNGSAASPTDPANWVNGNLNGSQAHYAEGLSVGYRTILTDMPPDTEVMLILEYDVKHSSRHALDYLTHYDRLEPHQITFGHTAEEIDPTIGVAGFSEPADDTHPIPSPPVLNTPVAGQPTNSFALVSGGGGAFMSMWNGDITNISYPNTADLSQAQSAQQIEVTFTVGGTAGDPAQTVILAWGGHIASRNDWGFDAGVPRSAGGISGSPYHMRLIDWNLNNLGNQDRSLQADAVIPPPECEIDGPELVCEESENMYSVTASNAPNPVYNWIFLNNTTGAQITAGQGTPDVTVDAGTGPGSYTLEATVSDINGVTTCEITTTVEVGPDLSTSVTDITCNDDNGTSDDGAIDLTVTGNGPFTYDWSGPNSFTASTEDISNLEAGTYDVTVTDDNGCISMTSATVNLPALFSAAAVATDITCQDDNGFSADGAVNLTTTNGVGPFSYSWTGPDGFAASSEDLSGLDTPGLYSVVVTDDNGCVANASATVNAPALFSAAAVATDITCQDDNGFSADGAVDLTTTNGVGPFSYSWTGPDGFAASSEDLSGLDTPGLYSVVVTDDNGCVANASATVNAPALFSAAAVATDITCQDDNGFSADGAVDLTTTNGVGPFSYSWTGPDGFAASSEDLSGLDTPGLYSVVVTDDNGCVANASATVNAPALFSAAAVATDITCQDDNGFSADGAVDLTTTNGVGPFSYSWTGPDGFAASSEDLSGLDTPGLYSVVVTDDNGCVANASATVNAPALFSAAAVATDITCQDDNGFSADGAVDLTTTNGVGPFSYSWTGPDGFAASSEDLSGLDTPGLYSVVVTDDNGCVANASATVNAPALFSAAAVATDITCQDDNGFSADGAVDLTTTNGVGPFSYSWTGPDGFAASSEDLSGLDTPGLYSVVVTDDNGCVANASATVNAPALFSAAAVATDITCQDDNGFSADGAVDLTTTNGVGPFSYSWTGPDGFAASSEDLSGLDTPGLYSVVVTDDNGCVANASATVNAPALFSAAAVATDITCQDDNGFSADGAVNLTTTNGVGPFSYSWTGPDGFAASSEDLSGLDTPGLYSVVVTDDNGCVANASATVNAPALFSAAAVATDITCQDDNGFSADGAVDLTTTNGVGPFSYSWTGPDGFAASSEDLSGLDTPGLYSVVVTDDNGCVANASATVNAPALFSAAAVATDITCQDDNGFSADGAVDLTTTNGVGPFSYSWTGPDGFAASSEDLSGLDTPGLYSVVVTDDNGCVANASATVNAPALFSAAAVATDITCQDDNGFSADGAVDLTTTNGVGPFSYSWTGPDGFAASSEDLSGLDTPGLYSVVVTDDNGCVANASATVNAPALFSAAAVATDITCQDDNGFSADGAVDLTTTNGVGPFSYSWTGPDGFAASSEDLSGLDTPGLYSVVVTDDNGCVANASATVNAPALFSAAAVATDITCQDDNGFSADGAVNLTTTNGVGPFSYSWTGPDGFAASSEDLSGLDTPGLYSVVVTDDNGCVANASATVNAPALFSAAAVATDITCQDDNGFSADGAVDLTTTNGVGPFSYSWTGPDGFAASSEDLSGLDTPGLYSVVVTDDNGCVANASATVNAPALLTCSITPFSGLPECNGSTNNQLTATINGGTTPYTPVWSVVVIDEGGIELPDDPATLGWTIASGQGTNTINFTAGDTYRAKFKLDVTDDNGCTTTCETIVDPCSHVSLLKTTCGQVDPSQSWSFELYEGPDGFGGSVIASGNTSGDIDGIIDFNFVNLDPTKTYTICELQVPAGWSTIWKVDTDGDGVADMIVPPYNPNADDNPMADLGNRCFDFGANTNYPVIVGGTLVFEVDNCFPGGDPRTPGYWKNWNTCTNGGQAENAARNGGAAAGFFLLDDILNDPGISWCTGTNDEFTLLTCEDAVSILDQRDLNTGKKKASDAAYTLAMHLLAAQLNFAAGAETCQDAMDAVVAGEALLCQIGFDGTGGYLKGKGAGALKAQALELAGILDSYNNGLLCNGGAVTGAPVNSLEYSAEELANEAINNLQLKAYPNPFQDEATIQFTSPQDSYVILNVYSVIGVRVAQLFEGQIEANKVYEVTFDRGSLSDDTFIYRLNTDFGAKYGTLLTR